MELLSGATTGRRAALKGLGVATAAGITVVVLPGAAASASVEGSGGGGGGPAFTGWTLSNPLVMDQGDGLAGLQVDLAWDGTGSDSAWFVRFYRDGFFESPIWQSSSGYWGSYNSATVSNVVNYYVVGATYVVRLYLTSDTEAPAAAFHIETTVAYFD
jgi:hypothetical protein